MNKLARVLTSSLGIYVILVFAFALRLWKIGDWSLWEDEETSLYFSQNPGKHFPRHFPIFFLTLQGIFQYTGISIAVGRLVAAISGILTIWLTHELGRRFVSRAVGLLAALLVTLSFGHLFWSQSIRYYTLEVVFQLLCIICFLHGFERKNYVALLAANVAFGLALLTHFSAILLMPILIGYLGLMLLLRESEAGYGLRGYLVFGVPFVAILAVFAWQFQQFKKIDLIGGVSAGQSPLGIGMRLAVYFGAPLLLLGVLAPLVSRDVPRRILLFLLVGSLVPVLELVVIAQLGLAIVTWYYALFALSLFALLAAVALRSLYARGFRSLAAAAGLLTLACDAAFLTGYFTRLYGDRPRWQAATACLQRATHLQVDGTGNPDIFATVPGIIAHYLGVPPGETMGHPLVKPLPAQPPDSSPMREQWYIVEARIASPQLADWLGRFGEVQGRFESRLGPFDRTVVVYRYQPKKAAQ